MSEIETMTPEETAATDVPVNTPATVAESAPQAAPETEKPKEESKADTRPPHGYVPLAALHEARAQMKAMRDEVETMRRANAPKPPDVDDDPVECLKYTARDIAEVKQWREQQDQQRQQYEAHNQFIGSYKASAEEFSSRTPEFKDAYKYLIGARDRELTTLGYMDPRQRHQMIVQDEAQIVALAMQDGVNPAERLFAVAKDRGFKKTEPKNDAQKLDTIQRGQQAAKSLGAVSGGAEGELTLTQIAEMSEDEIAKVDPDKLRKAMGGK